MTKAKEAEIETNSATSEDPNTPDHYLVRNITASEKVEQGYWFVKGEISLADANDKPTEWVGVQREVSYSSPEVTDENHARALVAWHKPGSTFEIVEDTPEEERVEPQPGNVRPDEK